MIRVVIAFAAAATIAGCSWAPMHDLQASIARAFHRDGEPALASGIRKYEDGDYPEASKNFQSALELGLWNSDRVRAHKYLAFINCASGREHRCREEFRLALDIDPQMQLSPAEAGHPIWGPVFRSVKAGR
ncbi:MAG: TssQ family T6SS-associated lipoprotein [Burkholderiales bacterium]